MVGGNEPKYSSHSDGVMEHGHMEYERAIWLTRRLRKEVRPNFA
jgi:hypothetical protein